MPRPSLLSLSAALATLAAVAALSACSPSKPPETPEASGDTPKDKGDKDKGEADSAKEASPDPSEAGNNGGSAEAGGKQGGNGVDKSMSLDTYEMTPSDCNELGRHYGDISRDDQMKTLSPKLSEKQRSSTAAQIDKVVSKIEEQWTTTCHSALENKAVDHDVIKCALAAKTVKDFDVCINGAGGTPQRTGKPGKKK